MIWFRGHTNETHKNIPTVMRNYEKKKDCYDSLRSYQQSNYERFKFRADGSLEMTKGVRYTQSDYIALMQHYEAPSNFLDWTENALTSLYFALEKYFDKELKEGDETYRNVTLAIFHPGIYNCIRFVDIDNAKDIIENSDETFNKMLDKHKNFASLIPNLSTKTNEKLFNMFLLGDMKLEETLQNMGIKDSYILELEDLYMPMAVLTSRLNPRIRTQCGCFVAYNLYTPQKPLEKQNQDKEKSGFEYISLEKIQEKKSTTFMYQITIDKECCADIVQWLKALGISKENIYPELSEKGYYFD